MSWTVATTAQITLTGCTSSIISSLSEQILHCPTPRHLSRSLAMTSVTCPLDSCPLASRTMDRTVSRRTRGSPRCQVFQSRHPSRPPLRTRKSAGHWLDHTWRKSSSNRGNSAHEKTAEKALVSTSFCGFDM